MGRLGRPHGLGGFLGFHLDEQHVSRVQPGTTVLVGETPRQIKALHRADRGYRVAFDEVTDRVQAEAIRGSEVYLEGVFHLEEDEFWPAQLVGLVVIDHVGNEVGVVSGVDFGPSQERLVVSVHRGGVVEIPFVAALVPEVDLERGLVRIADLPGLIAP